MLTVVYYVYENITAQTSFAAAGAVFLFVIKRRLPDQKDDQEKQAKDEKQGGD